MQFLNGKYLSLLTSLINELDISKQILNEVKESGNINDSKKIIEQYERLFLSEPLSKHIELKIAFVGKSTHSLFFKHLTKDNANRHITLNLISSEAIWFDQLYENRISDLLKFFKHLFSAIENYSIYQNWRNLEQFETLINEIKKDIDAFVSINIEADKKQPDLLIDLNQKENEEKEKKQKGV